MKILDTSATRYPTPESGRICDRCGHRVQQHRDQSITLVDERSAVSIGAELAKFVTVDLDLNSELLRADLCPACGDAVMEMMRPLLGKMRQIADRNPQGVRTYNFRAIDAESGRAFSVSSIIDDGA